MAWRPDAGEPWQVEPTVELSKALAKIAGFPSGRNGPVCWGTRSPLLPRCRKSAPTDLANRILDWAGASMTQRLTRWAAGANARCSGRSETPEMSKPGYSISQWESEEDMRAFWDSKRRSDAMAVIQPFFVNQYH